ncbi:MAG: hypothetical protein PHQ47_02575 [Candidatus Portnoybacteria bacterium]|nr:hypothetical protein [Candidatus Portnoybacteria bacterium]
MQEVYRRIFGRVRTEKINSGLIEIDGVLIPIVISWVTNRFSLLTQNTHKGKMEISLDKDRGAEKKGDLRLGSNNKIYIEIKEIGAFAPLELKIGDGGISICLPANECPLESQLVLQAIAFLAPNFKEQNGSIQIFFPDAVGKAA